jgi:hypothetical protein
MADDGMETGSSPPDDDSSAPGEPRRCAATTRAGGACYHLAVDGSDFCEQHDPDAAELLRERMSKLGKAGRQKQRAQELEAHPDRVPLETIDDLRAVLEIATALVLRSSGDAVSRANALARQVTAALTVLEKGVMAAELAELKATVAQLMEER